MISLQRFKNRFSMGVCKNLSVAHCDTIAIHFASQNISIDCMVWGVLVLVCCRTTQFQQQLSRYSPIGKIHTHKPVIMYPADGYSTQLKFQCKIINRRLFPTAFVVLMKYSTITFAEKLHLEVHRLFIYIRALNYLRILTIAPHKHSQNNHCYYSKLTSLIIDVSNQLVLKIQHLLVVDNN